MEVDGLVYKTKLLKMEPHYYNVDIHWEKDRKGMMCSSELNKEEGKCIEVATPKEFTKGMPGIWSPEHLFTAAVNSYLLQKIQSSISPVLAVNRKEN